MNEKTYSFTIPVNKQIFALSQLESSVAKEDSLNLLSVDRKLLQDVPEALHLRVKNTLHKENNITWQKQASLLEEAYLYKQNYIKELNTTYSHIMEGIAHALATNYHLRIVLEGTIHNRNDSLLISDWETLNKGQHDALKAVTAELMSKGWKPFTTYYHKDVGSLSARWIITFSCSFTQ